MPCLAAINQNDEISHYVTYRGCELQNQLFYVLVITDADLQCTGTVTFK